MSLADIDMDSLEFTDSLYHNAFTKLRARSCRHYIYCDGHADENRHAGGDKRCDRCVVLDALETFHRDARRTVDADTVNDALENYLERA